MRHAIALTAVLSAVCLAASTVSARANIISVDFGIDGSPVQSGVEPAAAAADSVFGNANVWNHLNLVEFGPQADPTFSSLLDSNGNTTSVGFSIVGTVGGASFNFGELAGAVRTDYMFFNSRD